MEQNKQIKFDNLSLGLKIPIVAVWIWIVSICFWIIGVLIVIFGGW